MNPPETVARYYDAWQNKQGDFSDVPLADDFAFTGPIASFNSADGYRANFARASLNLSPRSVPNIGRAFA
jgi:hypothetical protein